MLKEMIDAYEELKKYVYVINRGNKKPIIIVFKDENFYHLAGLHYTNIDFFIPKYITNKTKLYKYLKKNAINLENTLINQIKEKTQLEMRIRTFHYILDLLDNYKTMLYDLKQKVPGSRYEGDYGLLKLYEDDAFDEVFCLLGLVEKDVEESRILCSPQSWMVTNRGNNKLVYGKRPMYMKEISAIPVSLYKDTFEIAIDNQKELVS